MCETAAHWRCTAPGQSLLLGIGMSDTAFRAKDKEKLYYLWCQDFEGCAEAIAPLPQSSACFGRVLPVSVIIRADVRCKTTKQID